MSGSNENEQTRRGFMVGLAALVGASALPGCVQPGECGLYYNDGSPVNPECAARVTEDGVTQWDLFEAFYQAESREAIGPLDVSNPLRFELWRNGKLVPLTEDDFEVDDRGVWLARFKRGDLVLFKDLPA